MHKVYDMQIEEAYMLRSLVVLGAGGWGGGEQFQLNVICTALNHNKL